MDRNIEIEELVKGFKVLQAYFSKDVKSKRVLKSVTPAQWRALTSIAKEEQVTVRTLADMLSVTSSAATQIVNTLEEKDFIVRKRDTVDGRITRIELSKKMKRSYAVIKEEKLSQMRTLFSALDDKELKQYAKLHRKLISHISQH